MELHSRSIGKLPQRALKNMLHTDHSLETTNDVGEGGESQNTLLQRNKET